MDFSALRLPGRPLALVETYIDYGGPRTFALRGRAGEMPYYFVNSVDEDEETGQLWLVAARVSAERFRAVRSGLVPFREAFTEAEIGELFRIVIDFDEETGRPAFSTSPLRPDELGDSLLPSPAARLNLPTDTAEPFERQSLLPMSRARNRTIVAVELKSPDSNITEFPGKAFGEFSVAFSGEVDALRHELLRGHDDFRLRPSIVGLRAASFVVLYAFETEALAEPAEWSTPIIDGLNKLLAAAADPDTGVLLRTLSARSNAVRTKFRDMLAPLAAVGSGLELTSVVAYSDSEKHSALDAAGVRRAQQAILHVEPTVSHVEVRRGSLVGLNVRTRRFELFDSATAHTYKGYVDASVIAIANGLRVGGAEFIAARIRVEVPFAPEDEAESEVEGARYFIERLGTVRGGIEGHVVVDWIAPSQGGVASGAIFEIDDSERGERMW